MCKDCGREACEECYVTMQLITSRSPSTESSGPPAPSCGKKKVARLLRCTSKSKHDLKDFVPVTRFHKAELEEAVIQMTKLMGEEGTGSPTNAGQHVSNNGSTAASTLLWNVHGQKERASLWHSMNHNQATRSWDNAGLSIKGGSDAYQNAK